MNKPEDSIRAASCADDYDPNSMPVDKAREFIARLDDYFKTELHPLAREIGRRLHQVAELHMALCGLHRDDATQQHRHRARLGLDAHDTEHGVHGIEDSPHVVDPPNGWIQNANDWPWSAAGRRPRCVSCWRMPWRR